MVFRAIIECRNKAQEKKCRFPVTRLSQTLKVLSCVNIYSFKKLIRRKTANGSTIRDVEAWLYIFVNDQLKLVIRLDFNLTVLWLQWKIIVVWNIIIFDNLKLNMTILLYPSCLQACNQWERFLCPGQNIKIYSKATLTEHLTF